MLQCHVGVCDEPGNDVAVWFCGCDELVLEVRSDRIFPGCRLDAVETGWNIQSVFGHAHALSLDYEAVVQ